MTMTVKNFFIPLLHITTVYARKIDKFDKFLQRGLFLLFDAFAYNELFKALQISHANA